MQEERNPEQDEAIDPEDVESHRSLQPTTSRTRTTTRSRPTAWDGSPLPGGPEHSLLDRIHVFFRGAAGAAPFFGRSGQSLFCGHPGRRQRRLREAAGQGDELLVRARDEVDLHQLGGRARGTRRQDRRDRRVGPNVPAPVRRDLAGELRDVAGGGADLQRHRTGQRNGLSDPRVPVPRVTGPASLGQRGARVGVGVGVAFGEPERPAAQGLGLGPRAGCAVPSIARAICRRGQSEAASAATTRRSGRRPDLCPPLRAARSAS